MQDRYVGDIGDYTKLSLVRRLAAGRKLGVAWYLHPNEGPVGDGRHVGYLQAPERWRAADPEVFDFLVGVASQSRRVAALHDAFEQGTLFASEQVPGPGHPRASRSDARKAWFDRICASLQDADIVFADPDNGLVSDDLHHRSDARFAKRLPISEVLALSDGRPAIIYHHNSRFKGGHDAEVDFWMDCLSRPAIAVRCNAYSCRTFLVINPDAEIRERVVSFCRDWCDHKASLHMKTVARSP